MNTDQTLAEGANNTQQEQSPNRIRKILVTCLALVVAAGIGASGYFGYHYFLDYQQRYLSEAEARLSIDDRAGAIEALQSHVLINPDQIDQKIRLANLLYEIGNPDSAIRILQKIIDNLEGWQVDFYQRNSALSILVDWHSKSLASMFAEFDSVFSDDSLDEAERIAEEIESLILSHPYIQQVFLIKMAFKSQDDESLSPNENSSYEDGLYSTLYKLTLMGVVQNYDKALARKAYIAWRQDKESDVKTVLSDIDYSVSGLSPGPDKYSRLNMYADLVFEYASDAFGKKHWKEASLAYGHVHSLVSETLSDGKIGETNYQDQFESWANLTLYNQAISEFNANRYWISTNLLLKLQKDYPNYDTAKVADVLVASREGSVWQRYTKLQDNASEVFGNDNWIAAIAAYQDVADYLLRNGYKLADDLVAEARYNKAMAQWNARRRQAARETLLAVKKDSPGYSKNLVAEQLVSMADSR